MRRLKYVLEKAKKTSLHCGANQMASNGVGTRVEVRQLALRPDWRMRFDFDGYFLVRTPSRARSIQTTLQFPSRQLLGSVIVDEVGMFDDTYRAIIEFRREVIEPL